MICAHRITISTDGAVSIFSLPELELLSSTPAFPHLPPIVTVDAPQRRMGAKEDLTAIAVVDMGKDGITNPYLVLTTANEDVVLYEPFSTSQATVATPWYQNLRFRKVPIANSLSGLETDVDSEKDSDDVSSPSIRRIKVGEYDAVYLNCVELCSFTE